MRNNETGEFELVVGNRQLLSGFFIVVLLFAVGVALGYILGQNSEKSQKPPDTAGTIPAIQSRPDPTGPVSAPPAQAQPDASGQPAGGVPTAGTQPAQDTQAAAPTPEQFPAAQPAAQAAPPPAAPAPAAAAGKAASPAIPAAGTYWQVMAVAHGDAEIMVRTLKDKGFPAVTSPGTKGLTRVLVGPYPDRQALSRAKSDLEAAGMATPYRVEIGADAGRQ